MKAMIRYAAFIYILAALAAGCKVRKYEQQQQPQVVIPPPAPDTSVAVKETKGPKAGHFTMTLWLSLHANRYFEKDSAGQYVLQEMDPLNNSALHFYEGMQMALKSDSIVRIRVLDVSDSVSALRDFITHGGKSDLNFLVAGNATTSSFASAASQAKIPLMIMQNSSTSVLAKNSRSWLCIPTNKTQCRQTAGYIRSHNATSSFAVVYREQVKKESDLADLFYSELVHSKNDSDVCKKINYTVSGLAGVSQHLKADRNNVIFLLSSDQSFVSSFMKNLDTLEQYNITITGLPSWEYFESIDLTLMERFNTHLFSGNYLDYDNEQVRKLRSTFIKTYHTDPLPSAFIGYDIYNWIWQNFSRHGTETEKYEPVPSMLCPSGYDFRQACDNCGFENQYISVLRFSEGSLVKVN